MKNASLAVAPLFAGFLLASPAAAQELRAPCADASRDNVRTFCENVADAIVILQPRLGVALAGGNPVSGTASTLGMRIGTMPRVSIGLRVTAAEVDLPPVERLESSDDVRFPLGSIAADMSVGLFQGISLAPTVGGFGSVDLLASAGVLPLPYGEGFDDTAPLTWAVGTRVGILRESFTAPGVSLSAMYRRLGTVTWGTPTFQSGQDAFFQLDDYSVVSLRGVVGKRVLGVGLTAGAGWDSHSADVRGSVPDPVVLDTSRQIDFAARGLSDSRMSLFGNASFTLLIVNLAAEIGWQDGGTAPEGASDKLEERGLFGGLSVRLTF
jgi:hypothetical protein